ncbi:unnamed protein product, partial [Agarophyton chilense]
HAVRIAADELRAASRAAVADGYGVMLVLCGTDDTLLRVVLVACVDDVFKEPIWCHALRCALSAPSSASDEALITLALALVVHAVDAGSLVRALGALRYHGDDATHDLLSMYGAYVNGAFVSAHDVFHAAVRTRGTLDVLRCDALHALMWNLTALDLNTSQPSVSWNHRLAHNLLKAGVPGETVYRMPLAGVLDSLPAAFDADLAAARRLASRIRLRHGVVYVIRLTLRQIVSWLYIVFSISISCACAVQNWPRRDNAFERAKDAVDVATVLLVSVFGLVKLTSEDPNALKSLARGRAPLRDLAHATRFLRGHEKVQSIQRLLGVERPGLEWVGARGCCYGRSVQHDGLDAMPAGVRTLKTGGFLFLEGICKRPYFWDSCVKIHDVTLDVASFDKASHMHCELDFSNAPRYESLA